MITIQKRKFVFTRNVAFSIILLMLCFAFLSGGLMTDNIRHLSAEMIPIFRVMGIVCFIGAAGFLWIEAEKIFPIYEVHVSAREYLQNKTKSDGYSNRNIN